MLVLALVVFFNMGEAQKFHQLQLGRAWQSCASNRALWPDESESGAQTLHISLFCSKNERPGFLFLLGGRREGGGSKGMGAAALH